MGIAMKTLQKHKISGKNPTEAFSLTSYPQLLFNSEDMQDAIMFDHLSSLADGFNLEWPG